MRTNIDSLTKTLTKLPNLDTTFSTPTSTISKTSSSSSPFNSASDEKKSGTNTHPNSGTNAQSKLKTSRSAKHYNTKNRIHDDENEDGGSDAETLLLGIYQSLQAMVDMTSQMNTEIDDTIRKIVDMRKKAEKIAQGAENRVVMEL